MSLLDDQPQRMAREKRQLEALARGELWFRMQEWGATTAGDLEVRFTLKLLNSTFDGVLAYTFAAAKGFVLDIDHNGERFRTDEHAQMSEPFFAVTSSPANGGLKEGVATIAFPTEAAADVAGATAASLAFAPRLDLVSGRAIDGTLALNKAVAEAKSALVHFRSRNQLERVHLFIKAPSHFAMVLGHRLNAVGRIQLYDWVDGRYVATAVLA